MTITCPTVQKIDDFNTNMPYCTVQIDDVKYMTVEHRELYLISCNALHGKRT